MAFVTDAREIARIAKSLGISRMLHLPEVLPHLRTHLAMLHGSADKTIPLSVVEYTVDLIPRNLTSLTVLEGAGHDFEDHEKSQDDWILKWCATCLCASSSGITS